MNKTPSEQGIFQCYSCGTHSKPGEVTGWRVFVHGQLQQPTCPDCLDKSERTIAVESLPMAKHRDSAERGPLPSTATDVQSRPVRKVGERSPASVTATGLV